MKQLLRRMLASAGYEVCRLSPSERQELPAAVPMNYKEAQVYRALTAGGQISLVEARQLMKLVASSDPARPIVEVGMLYGHSTFVMCLAKAPGQRLLAVDNFSWNSLGVSAAVHAAATRQRLGECVREHAVEIVQKPAGDFYASYAGPPPALYFCDADHSYEAVKADIGWAKSVGASIICGDDYEHTGVKRAVDEVGGPRELHGGLWSL